MCAFAKPSFEGITFGKNTTTRERERKGLEHRQAKELTTERSKSSLVPNGAINKMTSKE